MPPRAPRPGLERIDYMHAVEASQECAGHCALCCRSPAALRRCFASQNDFFPIRRAIALEAKEKDEDALEMLKKSNRGMDKKIRRLAEDNAGMQKLLRGISSTLNKAVDKVRKVLYCSFVG